MGCDRRPRNGSHDQGKVAEQTHVLVRFGAFLHSSLHLREDCISKLQPRYVRCSTALYHGYCKGTLHVRQTTGI